MRKSTTSALLLSIFVALSVGTVAFGQGTASRVTGTVLDEKGAAMPGAVVTLTSEATQTSINTETNSSGNYVFDSVQVGIYSLSVEKPGFKKFVSTGNAANVNQPTTVNVTLEIGAIEQVVQVMASAEAVQTGSSGNFGNTVEQATYEASRCLSCGNCCECDGCLGACPEDAVIKLGVGHGYEFVYDRCTGCAACYEQCPVHSIEMIPEYE